MWILLLAAWPLAALSQESAPPAERPRSLLEEVVLVQDGEDYTADEVLQRAARDNPGLLEQLRRDPEALKLHLRSHRFYETVEAFGDLLLLDGANVPEVGREALLAEAKAWAVDHRSQLFPETVLTVHGPQIEVRARLLALQPESHSQAELRRHFLRSVPEFFGEMQVAWIRLPLASPDTGAVLPSNERRARARTLAEVKASIEAGELSWKEAVQRYCEDPVTSKHDGMVGVVRRRDLARFEEPLLRQAFLDLGVKTIEESFLRGPILGDKWVYLLRIDWVRSTGVVDMTRVLPEVRRSLRERELRKKLEELSQEVDRTIRLPYG